LFDRATSEPACSFIRLYWHQISFVLLLYGQRIDTHLTWSYSKNESGTFFIDHGVDLHRKADRHAALPKIPFGFRAHLLLCLLLIQSHQPKWCWIIACHYSL